MDLKVTEVDRIALSVPFRDEVRSFYEVDLSRLHRVDLIRVETNAGVVGHGESLPLLYPERTVKDSDISSVLDRHPLDLAHTPIGTGLQAALLDAAGKALDLPVHSILGLQQIREWCRIAWWSGQVAPLDTHVSEAAIAHGTGYRYHKIKARPWLDVLATIQAISAEVGQEYTVEPDWNSTLLTAGDATEVLRRIEEQSTVGLHETPIRPDDVGGLRSLRDALERPIVDHFTPASFKEWIRLNAVDGFVATGRVPDLVQQGRLAEQFNLTCFLQVVGLGITTALLLHLSAVLAHARWPIVTGMNVFADDLLVEPIQIRHGEARVPPGPGLGVTLNEDAVNKYRVDPEGDTTQALARRLLSVHFPNGRIRRYTDIGQLRRECTATGDLPLQSPGVRLEVLSDDGTAWFEELFRDSS